MAVSEFLEEFSLASACVAAFAAGRLKAVKNRRTPRFDAAEVLLTFEPPTTDHSPNRPSPPSSLTSPATLPRRVEKETAMTLRKVA
jgi:hypothetical protein